jgi:GxxExxY protein
MRIPVVIEDDTQDQDPSSELETAIFFTNKATRVPNVTDYASFEEELPAICNSIFDMLSSIEREATYQRCLAIDLEEAGVNVEMEVEIPLVYKGRRVGSRKADIVLTTPRDNKKVALECKALNDLNSTHLKQLQFYMHHMAIDTGFLINFPHDQGFPNVPTTKITTTSAMGSATSTTFVHEFRQGDGTLSDRVIRGKNANATVQIVKVQRVHSSSRLAQSFVEQKERVTFVAPLTKKGTPCTRCLKSQKLCYQHKKQ